MESLRQEVCQIVESTSSPSFRSVADDLNRRGVRTRRGGEWHPGTVNRLLEKLDISLTAIRDADHPYKDDDSYGQFS